MIMSYVHPGLLEQRDEAVAELAESRRGFQSWQATERSDRAWAAIEAIDRSIEEHGRIMEIQGRLVDARLALLHKQHQWEDMERNNTAWLYDERDFFGLPPLTKEQIEARHQAVTCSSISW